jgi:hypothetical protein
MRIALLASTVVMLSATPLAAQGPTTDAARAGAECTYDTCALRVDNAWFSDGRLIRGLDGKAANLGFTGGALVDAVATVPEAQREAMQFRTLRTRSRTVGLLTTIVSSALAVAWLRDTEGGERKLSDGLFVGSAATSIVGGLWAGIDAGRASKHMSRAVWIYNRSLSR